ncbi:hypothetical protein GCM10023322_74640 [Rugosimonospora acidiphila]|uniref:Uncharacterized protein n=1 Tax=Rugosimonospora acidiphila TaxID=556531 RepID=A0ABP9SNN4_9ACTN
MDRGGPRRSAEPEVPGQDGYLAGEPVEEFGRARVDAAGALDDVRQRGGRHGHRHQHDDQAGRIEIGGQFTGLLPFVAAVAAYQAIMLPRGFAAIDNSRRLAAQMFAAT